MTRKLSIRCGEWGTKLKFSIGKAMRILPVWKFTVYLTVILILTFVTAYMVVQSVSSFILNSVTLAGLADEVISLIGYYKFTSLSRIYGPLLYFLLHIIIFSFYAYLLYRHIKGEFYQHTLREMIDRVAFIAKGNFDRKIETADIPELAELSDHVNEIVGRLKKSIEEERLAEQAKKDLITNVSHDLRTPLTSIIGFLGLIEQDKYRDETELRYYVQTASDKANTLNKLLDDLFEYTRMQNRGLQLKKEPINLGEMLGQLAVQFDIQFKSAGMDCRLFLPEQYLMVYADGYKLARVFENLITNAIKYGGEGRYLDIFAKENETSILVEVVNYAHGISSMDLPFIFERFYRVEKSRSDSDKSSGLGLAIAKAIVELHDGTRFNSIFWSIQVKMAITIKK